MASGGGNISNKPLKYSVINSSGVSMKSGLLLPENETLLDISGFPAGFYFIVLNRDDWIKAYKYVLTE